MRADEIREMANGGHRRRGSASWRRSSSACKFRSATEPLEDPLRLRVIRRDIARLKTVLREQSSSARERPNG